MSCDQCREREAVIHLTQIVNEQVTTLQEAQAAVSHLQGALARQAGAMRDAVATITYLEHKVSALTTKHPA